MMRRVHLILAAALAAALPIALPAQQPAAPIVAGGVPVRADGLVATWYPPASGKRGPALIVLGGSEGRERGAQGVGRAFAREGYGVLALAWFKAPGLPEQLEEVPLEYFNRAIAWLKAQPLTDGNLGAHLATLEKAGYVRVDKKLVGKRTRTLVALTAAGRGAFQGHLAFLRAIVGER